MKKVLAMVMTLVMVLAMVGCGKSKDFDFTSADGIAGAIVVAEQESAG